MSKVLTTSGLTYFANEFNKLVDGKLSTLNANVEARLELKSDVGHTHSDYADKTITQTHIDDLDIHVTEADKVKWNEYQGLITAIQNAISGTSKVKVVPDMKSLNTLTECKEGDIAYVLDATGHPEAIKNESLGFIYADLGEGSSWVLFSDLKPSLDASGITITEIADITGVNVQEALESIVSKIVATESRLSGIDTTIGEINIAMEELEVNKLDSTHKVDELGHNLVSSSTHGFMSKEDKVRLDGLITAGGEENQNAFSNVKVGDSNITATTKTDTVEFRVTSNSGLTIGVIDSKVEIGTTSLTEEDIKSIIDGITVTPS